MAVSMLDLNDEILTKVEGKFKEFKIAIKAELREPIKQEVLEALENEIKINKNWNPLFTCFRNI